MHNGPNLRNRDHLSTDQQDHNGELMSGEVNMDNKFSPGRVDSGEL